MLKPKHVVFRTNADVDEARRRLEANTARGSPSADNLIDTMKDTLRTDQLPFRGEVAGNQFRLTRRRRGRQVRVELKGSLEPRPEGGTEVRASMAPPRTLMLGVYASVLAVLILSGGLLASGAPLWAALLVLLAEGPSLAIASRLYDRETSATFSALRDAVPEQVMPAVAPISEPVAEATADATAERTR